MAFEVALRLFHNSWKGLRCVSCKDQLEQRNTTHQTAPNTPIIQWSCSPSSSNLSTVFKMDSSRYLDGAHQDADTVGVSQSENPMEDDHSLREASAESTGAISSSHVKAFDRYEMNHADRGYALIFNNREFDEGKLEERRGTDMDLKRMLSLLKNEFGFTKDQVKTYHNVSTQDMRNHIIIAAEKDYTNCDCFICVILSYGTRDGDVYGADGDEPISLAELMEPLKGKTFQASKSLIGKPKIFFVQACPLKKGDKTVRNNEHDAALDDDEESKNQDMAVQVRIPSEADFFIACSTVPECLTKRGSQFIQTFSDVAKAKHNVEDLLSMLTITNNKIIEKKGEKAEVPFVKSTLTRKVFFKNA